MAESDMRLIRRGQHAILEAARPLRRAALCRESGVLLWQAWMDPIRHFGLVCAMRPTHTQCLHAASTLGVLAVPRDEPSARPAALDSMIAAPLATVTPPFPPHVSPPWQARGPRAQPRPFPFDPWRALSPLPDDGGSGRELGMTW